MRATNDLDLKRWASLKRPPCEDVLRGAVRPVRLKPGLDVLVTGDGDETELAAADLAGHGGTADLGDGAVHDRRELVEDDGGGGQGQGASQVATESLAGAEDVVGPKPTLDRSVVTSLMPRAGGKSSTTATADDQGVGWVSN